jgi:hypothetical protein
MAGDPTPKWASKWAPLPDDPWSLQALKELTSQTNYKPTGSIGSFYGAKVVTIPYDSSNEIDMRKRAIEGINDFIALIEEAQRHNRRTDTAMITPEQKNILKADPKVPIDLDLTGMTVVRLFGHRLKVKP